MKEKEETPLLIINTTRNHPRLPNGQVYVASKCCVESGNCLMKLVEESVTGLDIYRYKNEEIANTILTYCW